MSQFLMATIGTSGDVAPFLELGSCLMDRGHRVVVLTHAVFEERVSGEGLAFEPIDTPESYHDWVTHPDLMNWRKNPGHSARTMVLPVMAPVYERLRRRHTTDTVLVATQGVTGARLANEKLSLPLVTIHLAPMMLRSLELTPEYGPIRPPAFLGKTGSRLGYLLQDLIIDRLYKNPINAFRRQIGLERIRSSVFDWWPSQQHAIGLWPEWYAPRQQDWPPCLLAGFVGSGKGRAGPEVERDGVRRVVFTGGSGIRRTRDFFVECVEACRLLNLPGALVSHQKETVAELDLPANVIHHEYLPFDTFLPEALAIVHHAGIGTIANSIKAGIPQVACPSVYDQFDNARRLESLGIGRSIPPSQLKADVIARSLSSLLESVDVAEQCKSLSSKIDSRGATEKACDYLESVRAAG